MSEEMEKNILKILRSQERQEKLNNLIQERLEKQEKFNNLILECFENLEKEVKETRSDLDKFSNHFTAFEFENNRKVDLLLETYNFDHEQFKKYNKDIFNLKEKTSNHDTRIDYLELKVAVP